MSFVQTLKSLFVKPQASVADVLSAPAVPAAKPIATSAAPVAKSTLPDWQNNQARRIVISKSNTSLAWPGACCHPPAPWPAP